MMRPIPPYALYLIDADGTLLDFEAGRPSPWPTPWRISGCRGTRPPSPPTDRSTAHFGARWQRAA